MYNLKAERRDNGVKAKKLRRNGLVPASMYGRNLKESIHLQIPAPEVKRFLTKASKGNTLIVEVDDKKYNALFKEVTYDPLGQQVQQIEFLHIVADEAVNSVMAIVLENRDKNQNLIQQHIEEIPYNALPKDFVPEVVIDLDGMPVGHTVKLSDLDVAKNEHIKLLIPEDTDIVSVSELKRAENEEETEEEEAAAE